MILKSSLQNLSYGNKSVDMVDQYNLPDDTKHMGNPRIKCCQYRNSSYLFYHW